MGSGRPGGESLWNHAAGMELRVECYAGYRGEEAPRRFRLGGKEIEVKEIVDRWIAPDHRYFKVLGQDNSIYILRHDSVSYHWELAFYEKQTVSE